MLNKEYLFENGIGRKVFLLSTIVAIIILTIPDYAVAKFAPKYYAYISIVFRFISALVMLALFYLRLINIGRYKIISIIPLLVFFTYPTVIMGFGYGRESYFILYIAPAIMIANIFAIIYLVFKPGKIGA